MAGSRTRTSLAGAAVVAALALPGGAAAATATYPSGGSGFTAGAEGWTGVGGGCTPNVAGGLCSSTAEHTPDVGNPAGALNSRLDLLVNAGGLFRGATSWTSPDFDLPAGTPVRSAAVALDRRLDGGGLALDPASTYTTTLIDRSAGNKTVTLATETLGQTDTTFVRNGSAVAAAALVPGHRYAIQIATDTSTRVARVGLLGSLNTRFDNVALTTDDAAAGGGGGPGGGGGLQPIGDGAQGTPGVTVRRSALSNSAITLLMGSINPNAEVGKGPGGSLVPLAKCTIVGTAGKDRIKGTKGNDVICGLGGNDRIGGAGGKDVVDTANGNDVGGGASGKDMLIGVRGRDRLSGGKSADRLGGGASGDRMNGNSGNDRVHGGSAKDVLSGSTGNDRVVASKGNDRANGNSGNDRIDGSSGNDRLTGGKGADRIGGGSGRDRIAARDRKRDRVDGGTGRDMARLDRRARAGSKRATRLKSRKRADRVRRIERRR